jgi:outer membrane protein assembly factor BamB
MSRPTIPIAAAISLLAITASAADWPNFAVHPPPELRSPPHRCRRTSAGKTSLKTELPPGHSSPAIVGNKIFLTAVREKERLETIALDRASGKIVWRSTAPHKSLEKIHSIGSYAQPSPAVDEERVVTMFGSSGLYCYDHAGKQLWHVAMGPFNDEFGAAASPVIADDRVLVAQDHDTGSFLAAYDKRTGQELWRTDRGEFSRGYCTPVVWTVDGQKQVVVSGTLRVDSYDWNTGVELWTVRGLSRVVCITPTIGDDNTLYAAGWSAGGEPGDAVRLEPFADYMAQFDENKNGAVENSEIGNSTALKTRFAQCDRDKDGHITQQEYEDFRDLFDKSQNGVLAIRPGGRGDVTGTHLACGSTDTRRSAPRRWRIKVTCSRSKMAAS